jgi:hypothetical protein
LQRQLTYMRWKEGDYLAHFFDLNKRIKKPLKQLRVQILLKEICTSTHLLVLSSS